MMTLRLKCVNYQNKKISGNKKGINPFQWRSGDCITFITSKFEEMNTKFGKSKAREFILFYEGEGYIKNTGKDNATAPKQWEKVKNSTLKVLR